jgi:hypothetical protein
MNGAKNQFVTLNIGGVRYQTLKSVLQSIPNTLLGNMFNENNSSILHEQDEYFFDRNGRLFEYIIDVYRNGGNVIMPSDASEIERVLQEFRYWGIEVPPPPIETEPVYDIATMLPYEEDSTDPPVCNLLLTGNDAKRFFAILDTMSAVLDDINIIVDHESVVVNAIDSHQVLQLSLRVPSSCFAPNSRWCSKLSTTFVLPGFSWLAKRYRSESIIGLKIVLLSNHVVLFLEFESGVKLHVKKTLLLQNSVPYARVRDFPLLYSVQFESVLPLTKFLRFRSEGILLMTFCNDVVHANLSINGDDFTGTFACVYKFGRTIRSLRLRRSVVEQILQQFDESQFRLGIDVKGADDGNLVLVQFSFLYDNQPAGFHFVISIGETQIQ